MDWFIVIAVFGLLAGLIIASDVNRSDQAKRRLQKLSKIIVVMCAVYFVGIAIVIRNPDINSAAAFNVLIAVTFMGAHIMACFIGPLALGILIMSHRQGY